MRRQAAVAEFARKTVPAAAFAPYGVHITSDDGDVDQTTLRIRKSAQEQVAWFANGNTKATILFASADGSPFQESIFHVPAGGGVSSGPIKDAAECKPYKYTVVGPTGVNDPVVIIDK